MRFCFLCDSPVLHVVFSRVTAVGGGSACIAGVVVAGTLGQIVSSLRMQQISLPFVYTANKSIVGVKHLTTIVRKLEWALGFSWHRFLHRLIYAIRKKKTLSARAVTVIPATEHGELA